MSSSSLYFILPQERLWHQSVFQQGIVIVCVLHLNLCVLLTRSKKDASCTLQGVSSGTPKMTRSILGMRQSIQREKGKFSLYIDKLKIKLLWIYCFLLVHWTCPMYDKLFARPHFLSHQWHIKISSFIYDLLFYPFKTCHWGNSNCILTRAVNLYSIVKTLSKSIKIFSPIYQIYWEIDAKLTPINDNYLHAARSMRLCKWLYDSLRFYLFHHFIWWCVDEIL